MIYELIPTQGRRSTFFPFFLFSVGKKKKKEKRRIRSGWTLHCFFCCQKCNDTRGFCVRVILLLLFGLFSFIYFFFLPTYEIFKSESNGDMYYIYKAIKTATIQIGVHVIFLFFSLIEFRRK